MVPPGSSPTSSPPTAPPDLDSRRPIVHGDENKLGRNTCPSAAIARSRYRGANRKRKSVSALPREAAGAPPRSVLQCNYGEARSPRRRTNRRHRSWIQDPPLLPARSRRTPGTGAGSSPARRRLMHVRTVDVPLRRASQGPRPCNFYYHFFSSFPPFFLCCATPKASGLPFLHGATTHSVSARASRHPALMRLPSAPNLERGPPSIPPRSRNWQCARADRDRQRRARANPEARTRRASGHCGMKGTDTAQASGAVDALLHETAQMKCIGYVRMMYDRDRGREMEVIFPPGGLEGANATARNRM
ncbi:uncharacterized protein LAESUDRAFT_9235 [Laetiporus sulphureus 93-53]|uniref:Uncharacterized protein n=1 Tax=Laetiporus sulphureus 93-53 TaxID=1314785 RepID=A0A165I5P5_9APHY|nr:uncharacterized protein LAESUDRAFT_9235 [Laetiporus sulphureus 93-53]KZT12624.1 hypothetical protein LAESUDRAFT_9235 [Laetiporus sulphureus 93-53]